MNYGRWLEQNCPRLCADVSQAVATLHCAACGSSFPAGVKLPPKSNPWEIQIVLCNDCLENGVQPERIPAMVKWAADQGSRNQLQADISYMRDTLNECCKLKDTLRVWRGLAWGLIVLVSCIAVAAIISGGGLR